VTNDQPKPSRIRRTVADLSLTYTAIGVELSDRAAALGRTAGDERRAAFLALSHKLGLLGDQCHETRRALHDLAFEGGIDAVDESVLTTTADLGDFVTDEPIARHLPGWKRAIKRLLNL
jgi:hypothetical protein